MRHGPVPNKALPRWMLTIVRKLRLDLPLAQPSAKHNPPPTAASPLAARKVAPRSPAAVIAHIEALQAVAWAA